MMLNTPKRDFKEGRSGPAGFRLLFHRFHSCVKIDQEDMMRRVFLVLMFLVSSLSSVFSEPSQTVDLLLEFQPDHTLPAIPVNLKLSAKNLSASQVRLPEAILLEVMRDDGEKFVVETQGGYYGLLPEEYILNPGEGQDIWFPVGPALSSQWFFDPRLSWPGVYKLQLTLDRDPNPKLMGDKVIGKDPGNPRKIVSNEATLIVDVPQGEDA
ncbi:MAG TPA: hypothetical protein VJ521_04190, partial [Acidobacteriota bacterium]|nr:hypothetical protein [Acidobacteriota bacterium]